MLCSVCGIGHQWYGLLLSVVGFLAQTCVYVPRKCSVRQTGSVWQIKYNIYYPVRRIHMLSDNGGPYI